MMQEVNSNLQQEAYQYALPPPTTSKARLIGPTGPVKRACPPEVIEREAGFRKEFRISTVRGTARLVTNWQKRSMSSGRFKSFQFVWVCFWTVECRPRFKATASSKRCKQQHNTKLHQGGVKDVGAARRMSTRFRRALKVKMGRRKFTRGLPAR